MSFVTELPADPRDQDPLDPARILQELPERERELPQPVPGSAGRRPGSGWVEAPAARPADVELDGNRGQPARPIRGPGAGSVDDDAGLVRVYGLVWIG
jgi:hypothetical protein